MNSSVVFVINKDRELDIATPLGKTEWPDLTEQQAMVVAAMEIAEALREIAEGLRDKKK